MLSIRHVRKVNFLPQFCFVLFCFFTVILVLAKNSPTNEGNGEDIGLIPVLGRSLGGVHSNPLQYSCLQNSMDKGDWWAMVHGVTESQTQLSD